MPHRRGGEGGFQLVRQADDVGVEHRLAHEGGIDEAERRQREEEHQHHAADHRHPVSLEMPPYALAGGEFLPHLLNHLAHIECFVHRRILGSTMTSRMSDIKVPMTTRMAEMKFRLNITG